MGLSRTPPWPCHTLGDARQPLLVFLHGFLGRGEDWAEMAVAFAARYFCIMPDLPGHGANTAMDVETPLSYETLAIGLQATLAEFGSRPVVLTGYSLGGRIALYAGLRLQGLVRALVLESTSAGIPDAGERQARLRADNALADRLEAGGMDEFVEHWYAQPLFQSLRARPALLAYILQFRRANHALWMAKVLRELSPGRQPYLGERWGELKVPVLLLAGELDGKYAASLEETVAAHPQFHGLRVPVAGHIVHAERPARFNSILSGFLSRLG